MHNSDDKDEIGFDGVQNSVRKNMGETTTNIVVENPPTLRGFYNATDCVLNGLNEA